MKKRLIREFSSFLTRLTRNSKESYFISLIDKEANITRKVVDFLNRNKKTIFKYKSLGNFESILRSYLISRLTKVLSPERRNQILQREKFDNRLFRVDIGYDPFRKEFSISSAVTHEIIHEIIQEYSTRLFSKKDAMMSKKLSSRKSFYSLDMRILESFVQTIQATGFRYFGTSSLLKINHMIRMIFEIIEENNFLKNFDISKIKNVLDVKLKTKLNPTIRVYYRVLMDIVENYPNKAKSIFEKIKDYYYNPDRDLSIFAKDEDFNWLFKKYHRYNLITYQSAEKLFYLYNELKDIENSIDKICAIIFKKVYPQVKKIK